MPKHLEIIETMLSNQLQNYIVPGLSSFLLENGKVRLFKSTREFQEGITPHSHRFPFSCYVLSGSVVNRLWIESAESSGDFFEETYFIYEGDGGPGKFRLEKHGRSFYRYRDQRYEAGDWYSMTDDQIHSIKFSRGAMVLFFEGPSESDRSLMIEPVVDGEKIPTFEVADWMFKS